MDSEEITILRRLSRSNKIANVVLFLIVAIAGIAVAVAARIEDHKVDRYHEQMLRDHEAQQLMLIAQVDLLKWAHSDHSDDKDSNEVFNKIKTDLEGYIDHVHPAPSKPSEHRLDDVQPRRH